MSTKSNMLLREAEVSTRQADISSNDNVPWYRTCKEIPPATTVLQGEVTTDVVIIGAGVMGLSTALSLAESGVSTVVLEAFEIGDGASGRNGGLIVPIMRALPDQIRTQLGSYSDHLIQTVIDSADSVFNIVEKYEIKCDPLRAGFLQPVHAPRLMSSIEKSAKAWAACGASTEFIGPDETSRHLGTNSYHGALFEPAGGCVNPIAYTRGLARAGQALGVTIHTATPVIAATAEKGNKWKLSTPNGVVSANCVVQCVHAQIPGLSFTPGLEVSKVLIPFVLHGLASRPIPAPLRETILPKGEVATDTRNYLLSIGYDPDGRIVTSGAAPLGDGKIGMRQMVQFVTRRIARVYPELGELEFEYIWKGTAALNRGWLPRIYKGASGWYSLTSCNGRGMALSTAIGRSFGEGFATGNIDRGPVPVAAPKPVFMRNVIGGFMSRALMPAGALLDWLCE